MEIIPKVLDIMSATALILIVLVFLLRYRKKKTVSVEIFYKELVWPLKRPAVLFALLRQHYYCVGEESKELLIGATVMALMVVTAEYCMSRIISKEKERDED